MSKHIVLGSGGNYAYVDDEDYEYLNQFSWHLGLNGYAYRNLNINNTQEKFYMHHEIANRMNLQLEWGEEIDHKDRNRLNCRRENLRAASFNQSKMNTTKRRNTSSQYKGVCWNKRVNKWLARINKDGEQYYIGLFNSEIEAAKAYDHYAKLMFDEFAVLNFPRKVRSRDETGKFVSCI